MKSRALLFIHGLGGDATDTWGDFPPLIRADPSLSSHFDLCFFKYPTSLNPIRIWRKAPGIPELARALKTQIDNTMADYESIILVCHSLGGLIARKYLVDQVKHGSHVRIEKLLLFAVPNNGAGLASVAKYIAVRHAQLKQLCKDSELIEYLNTDWFTLKVGEQVIVKYVIASQDDVVHKTSAQCFPGNPNVEELANHGHISCVKPTAEDGYLALHILRNFVLPKPPSLEFVNIDIPPSNRSVIEDGDSELVDLFDKLVSLDDTTTYIRFQTYVGAGHGVDDVSCDQTIRAGVVYDMNDHLDGFGGNASDYSYGYTVELQNHSYRTEWRRSYRVTLLFPRSGNPFFDVHYMKSMNFEGIAKIRVSGMQGLLYIEVVPVTPTDELLLAYKEMKKKVGKMSYQEF